MAKNTFDFQALPRPDAITPVSYDVLLAERKKRFIEIAPQYKAVLELASEPLVIAMQMESYREFMLRKRLNDALASNLLAMATGSDLDHLGLFYGSPRSETETDEDYRMRIRDRTIASSTAGSKDHYRSRAMQVAPTQIKDVEVDNPIDDEDPSKNNGLVRISVLGRYQLTINEINAHECVLDDTNTRGKEINVLIKPVLIDSALPLDDKGNEVEINIDDIVHRVRQAVSADHVKVLTDTLEVAAADLVLVDVCANIYLKDSTPDLVFDDLLPHLIEQWENNLALDLDMTPSWLNAQLHRDGVRHVDLKCPTQLMNIGAHQCAVPQSITLRLIR